MKPILLFAVSAVLLVLAIAGCSDRGLGGNGDGGTIDCTTLSEAQCRSDSRCEAVASCCPCSPARCIAAGSQPPACNVACANSCADPCVGLDETSCKANGQCVADYCTECSCTPTYVGCRLPTSPQTMCPALGCPQPNCNTCDGLDEKSCIASESTLGCTPDYCPDCHGGQSYVGCSGPNEGTGACPALCPAGCESTSQCSNGQVCFAPGQPLCGGACMIPPPCTSDGDCSNGQICDFPICSCNGSMKGCIPGCNSDGDCQEGQMCDGTHHCVALSCNFPAHACPVGFDCVNGQTCIRRSCSSDSDCAGAFCVDGQCYSSLGMCSFLPG